MVNINTMNFNTNITNGRASERHNTFPPKRVPVIRVSEWKRLLHSLAPKYTSNDTRRRLNWTTHRFQLDESEWNLAFNAPSFRDVLKSSLIFFLLLILTIRQSQTDKKKPAIMHEAHIWISNIQSFSLALSCSRLDYFHIPKRLPIKKSISFFVVRVDITACACPSTYLFTCLHHSSYPNMLRIDFTCLLFV